MFYGEVITGPDKGFIAFVSNDDTTFEIHPMGDSKNREFYSRPAAEQLAKGHATLMNEGKAVLTSSWVKRRG